MYKYIYIMTIYCILIVYYTWPIPSSSLDFQQQQKKKRSTLFCSLPKRKISQVSATLRFSSALALPLAERKKASRRISRKAWKPMHEQMVMASVRLDPFLVPIFLDHPLRVLDKGRVSNAGPQIGLLEMLGEAEASE